MDESGEWGTLAEAFPEARGAIRDMMHALSLEAQGMPVAEHLAPRHVKPGTVDLTTATLFVTAVEKHALICNFARTLNKFVPYKHGKINLGAALELFFRTLHGLHTLWRQKNPLSPSDLTQSGLY